MVTRALWMLRVLGQQGVKLAIPHRLIGGFKSADPIRGCKLADCADSADQTTAKPLVQMKNLFGQKDSLGPCLEGAKV
jgi:hypothetical protein